MKYRGYFISYRRRVDGPIAEQIAKCFTEHFGDSNVFFDRDPQSLPIGQSWPYELISKVASCRTMLPIIGPGWLDELRSRNLDSHGGWLPHTEAVDWVRREIGFALQFGKRVVPILIASTKMPEASKLPPDLEALCEKQVFCLKASEPISSSMTQHFEQLRGVQDFAPAVRLHGVDIPASNIDEEVIDASTGIPWDPRTETDSPHECDYKVCVVDPDIRHRLRVELITANNVGELRQGFTLTELQKWVKPRKFEVSSSKKGMFIQASCVVSNGMSDGRITNLLMNVRNDFQFHDATKVDPRNVKGESCLIGTCLSAFGLHRGSGHLSRAVLNDLVESNPWAVFSRKLLVPDSVIDCRFLGVGFNLSDPDKEYVHLVWHVRTRYCPEVMLVPARLEKQHDFPIWQSLEQLFQYNFEKAPIDRHVVESLFKVDLPASEKPIKSPWLTGFVRFDGFDNTLANNFLPVRWPRDTVPLDLARMFQQYLHKDRLKLNNTRAIDILSAFADFVKELSARQPLPVSMQPIAFENVRAPFDNGLMLIVHDEASQPIGKYLVLAAEWIEPQLTNEIVSRVRERAHIGFANDIDPKAVVLLHGVHQSERSQIQGALSLHDPGETPIHVVRLALGPKGIELKRVAHAIIPVRHTLGDRAHSLLVTLADKNERPRLPGGKIEGQESPAQAIVREIGEELSLSSAEIELKDCIVPEGVNMIEISPSSGRLTHYRIFPFVVKIVGTGIEKTQRLVRDPRENDPCRVWHEPFTKWAQDGLGFDTAYAKAVQAMTTQEQLDDAAIDLNT
jgi:8-oxo-dGTP pyrophosphatase MutT (NUDIX family)